MMEAIAFLFKKQRKFTTLKTNEFKYENIAKKLRAFQCDERPDCMEIRKIVEF